MKIAIIGGHLTPALAVIDVLPKEAQCIFIGRKYVFEGDSGISLEYKIITERDIPFIPIKTGRIPRVITKHFFSSLIKIFQGFFEAFRILSNDKPDVVVGFGGYVSVPICLAAFFLKIPVVIHEQTLEAGLANKLLARFATKVCISWQRSARFFPKNKTVVTGNPLRQYQISNIKYQISNEKLPLLYVTGGSSGAHPINLLVEGCLEKLLQKYRIIHQTGDAVEFLDYDRISEFKSKLPETLQRRYYITKFVHPHEVAAIFHNADIIISRAGINTVTELLYFGKLCLLIPLPHGQKNEQLKNAQFVKKIGIGEYVLQDATTSDSLSSTIEKLLEHKEKYLVHAREAKSLIKRDAAEQVVKVIYEVVSKKK